MKNKFYKYIRKLMGTLPCLSHLDVMDMKLDEDEFINHLNLKYSLALINFEKHTTYGRSITDDITYYYKVNNLLYLEYSVHNFIIDGFDTKKLNNFNIINISAYSSLTNQKELLILLQYIDEYIKNKK
jgi:hypothetical protein